MCARQAEQRRRLRWRRSRKSSATACWRLIAQAPAAGDLLLAQERSACQATKNQNDLYLPRVRISYVRAPFLHRTPFVYRAAQHIALLTAPFCRLGAQAAVVTPPPEWRAWAFGRVGPAQTSAAARRARPPQRGVLGSAGGGLPATSYGAILGMVRATDTERGSFEDVPSNTIHDYAVLAGARSRGDRLFIAGAAGIAQVDGGNTGITTSSNRHLAPAFDLSAHADYRVAGVALALSGVMGPASSRYAAISLGIEVGWLGFY